jgi:DNA-binding NarL/FixJ family response regulator
MIDIVLVDDHKIIRDGIKAFLNDDSGIRVVGEGANGNELLEILEQKHPDVLLMDINMPEMDGFEATKAVKEKYPDIKVLVLSMLDHEKYVNKMMEAGATGYALKNAGKDELLFAIKTVASGAKFICTDIGLSFMNKLQSNPQPLQITTEKKGAELSNREIEVLRNIAEGLTNAEIADKLFTSKRTIESHRQNIIEKTQVKNTAALIKYALTNGIID